MDLKEIMLAQGFKRLDMEVAVGGYEEVPQLDPDMMHIKFILCHATENANGDTFTNEVLKQAQYTPRNKPVDWEHGQPIIGTILDSVYKEDANGVGYIEATGAIWKFIYPELSAQIKAKAPTGELKLSMECYYKDANYQIGDQIFDQETADRMGITNYVGRDYMGKKVARIFKEVIFGGVGVVANPADKNAVFLSVAKDLGLEGTESVANIVRTVNDFNTKQPTKEVNHAVTVAKFVKAFDKAKSSIVAKFNKEQIATKEQMIDEVRASMNALQAEVSSISLAYYRGTASENQSIEDQLQEAIASALNSVDQEAYLRTTEEGYVTYDVINYLDDVPLKTFKASFSSGDEGLVVDFDSATADQLISEEGENTQMSDTNKVEATELETTEIVEAQEEAVVASEEVATEEVVEEVVASEEVEVVEDKPSQAEASEFETTIATLQTELEAVKAEKVALADELAGLKARFAEIEAEKVLASRMSELKEAGIEFTGSRLEKESARIKVMSDEDFADHKELLLEVAGKKAETVVASVEEAEVEEATASETEVEEDIIVEGANKASAGVVIEQQQREVRPFGHLARR